MGAVGYPCVELIYRHGNSHWVMSLIGGIAMLIVINVTWHLKNINIIIRTVIATIFVTLLELMSGLIVNKWLNMRVWDYSNSLFNIEGQICLKFSLYWFILCFGVILVVDLLFLKRRVKG